MAAVTAYRRHCYSIETGGNLGANAVRWEASGSVFL